MLSILISALAGLSTVLGGLFVYLNVKDKNKFICFSLSFSLSVMISLSVLELIPDSFFVIYNLYGFIGSVFITILLFLIGYYLVKIINKRITLLENKSSLYRVGLLSTIALMLHNFPEGIATFMASYNDLSNGISLSLAIMMHNLPEGISISIPIYYATNSRKKGIMYSFISGLAEPLGAVVAYVFLKNYINQLTISYVLVIVAGIMVTLSINEMIPEVNSYCLRKYSYMGLIIGFIMVFVNILVF